MQKPHERIGKSIAKAAARVGQARAARKRRPRRRRRLPHFDLHKAMFVLPNLFTVSSIYCGVYAMLLVAGNPGPRQLYQASLAVFFGVFFDMVDGRVARLTKTQSEFGVQLDSLADLVTFGAAPAVIVHAWALSSTGFIGGFAAFCYVSCGAIRLARFNILSSRAGGSPSAHFIGVPIPVAAAMLISVVMLHQTTLATPVAHPLSVLTLVFVISYLMVSNVRYRSFKKLKLSKGVIATAVVLAAVLTAVAILLHPTFAVVVVVAAYIVLGMLEEIIFFRRRRREDLARKEAAAAAAADGTANAPAADDHSASH